MGVQVKEDILPVDVGEESVAVNVLAVNKEWCFLRAINTLFG